MNLISQSIELEEISIGKEVSVANAPPLRKRLPLTRAIRVRVPAVEFIAPRSSMLKSAACTDSVVF